MKRILYGVLVCALVVGVLVPLQPASVSAFGTAIYVDDDFIDNPSLHMWDTIQEGIDDADDAVGGDQGDTIYVYAGTYDENIVVDKGKLTIWGEHSSVVTVNGGGAGYTIDINANTVTIRQLTVIGGNPAGIHWGDVAGGTVELCDIRSNVIGVALDTLENQTVNCNQIHENTGDGIEVRDSTLKEINGNIIYSNYDGISLYNSTAISIENNWSANNSNYGVYVDEFSTNNNIFLNDFYGNTAGDGYSEGVYEQNELRTPSGSDAYCYGSENQTSPRGNYWGDYTDVDNNGDGIWDNAKPVGGSGELDEYPLVDSYVNYPSGTCPGTPLGVCAAEQPTPGSEPAAPLNLVATGGKTAISLDWDDSTEDDLAGYNVYRSRSACCFEQIATTTATESEYTDSDIIVGVTYYYVVTAFDTTNYESGYSNIASATTEGGCFIATASYGTSSAEEIDVLRAFRDEVMLESAVGSQLVDWYYQTSPPVADFISENAVLKALVREIVVDPIASLVEVTGAFWRD